MVNAALMLLSKDSDALLRELGLEHMSEEEKAGTVPRLLDHFSKVALEAAVEAMSPAERDRMTQALDNPAEAEKKIAEIAAGIPGLQDRINEAVQEEILTLRVAKEAL